MTPILLVFFGLLAVKLGISISLDVLNLRDSKSQAGEVPEAFRDFIDPPDYHKSIEYTVAKTRFGIVNDLFDAAVLVAEEAHAQAEGLVRGVLD